jgi:NADP-dependent 3-hydroxy acid dehydrogenase YdfG
MSKVALVTGASSGIGRAFSERFFLRGYKVVLVGRVQEKLDEVIGNLKGEGEAHACVCDVSVVEDCQKAIDSCITKFGKLDILVNCAGCMFFTLMKSQKVDDWHKMIDANCKGVVNMCGLAIPHFLENSKDDKHIINISSDAARTVFPALAVYNASKVFVQTFSKSLRCELVNTNVRVTDLQPGDCRTNLVMNNTDTDALGKVGVAGGELVGGNSEADMDRTMVLDPEDVVDAGCYAIDAKSHIGVHEILIEPRNQLFGDPTSVNA